MEICRRSGILLSDPFGLVSTFSRMVCWCFTLAWSCPPSLERKGWMYLILAGMNWSLFFVSLH